MQTWALVLALPVCGTQATPVQSASVAQGLAQTEPPERGTQRPPGVPVWQSASVWHGEPAESPAGMHAWPAPRWPVSVWQISVVVQSLALVQAAAQLPPNAVVTRQTPEPHWLCCAQAQPAANGAPGAQSATAFPVSAGAPSLTLMSAWLVSATLVSAVPESPVVVSAAPVSAWPLPPSLTVCVGVTFASQPAASDASSSSENQRLRRRRCGLRAKRCVSVFKADQAAKGRAKAERIGRSDREQAHSTWMLGVWEA